MATKFFCPEFFLQMLCPFGATRLGAFLAHGRQCGGLGPVYFVMSSQDFNSPQNKYNKSEGLQNGSIFFLLLTHSRRWLSKKGMCKAMLFSEPKQYMNYALCEWNTEMTSQSELDPFSCIVVHGPKKCPTSLLWKGTTSEGKIKGQKTFG